MMRLSPSDEFLKRNSIGFLRLVLASMVVFYHAFVLSGMPVPGHMYGVVAVSGFFFLSGVLITQSWEHSASLKDYLWRRTLRIFPGFWGCLLFSAFLITPIALYLRGRQFAFGPSASYVLHGLPMFGSHPTIGSVFEGTHYGNVMNGSLWTLPLEYICYLMVGAIGLAGLFGRRWLLLGIAVLFYIWHVLPQTRLPAVPHMPTSTSASVVLEPYLMFAIGSAAYLYREKISIPGWVGPIALALMIGVLAFELPSDWFQYTSRAVRVLALPVALLWLATVLPLQDFARKRDLSYGTYIYAFPIQQVLSLSGLVGWALFGTSYVLTLGMAFLSWHLVEGQAMKLKRAFATRKVRAPIATAVQQEA